MCGALPAAVLPAGISARIVPGVNGLDVHILESGTPGAPLLLLLHGFPELAYSWRKVMPLLAAAGYHVIAPDQRGYGRTVGCLPGAAPGFDVDLAAFRMPGLATDMLALVAALGVRRVVAVIGHDFGSPVAAWCALARPDVFPAVVLMSAPFPGPPPLPVAGADGFDLDAALASLDPPRQHYVHFYSQRQADADMRGAPAGLGAFLRGYYHVKSADWPGNVPVPLAGKTAADFARLPRYYVMDRGVGMAATVAGFADTGPAPWLTDAELAVYVEEFGRTGFQGGLNWYRGRSDNGNAVETLFAGRRIDVPAMFIAGAADWGLHQAPGALAAMNGRGCADLRGIHSVAGAGHWVQQEQPEAVSALVLDFLTSITGAAAST